jgi:hypothetical protein
MIRKVISWNSQAVVSHDQRQTIDSVLRPTFNSLIGSMGLMVDHLDIGL